MDESLDLREQDAVAQVFFMRERQADRKGSLLICVWPEETRARGCSASFLKQFYAGTPFIPRRDHAADGHRGQAEVIEEWLTSGRRGQKVRIRSTRRKARKKSWWSSHWENARMVLEQRTENEIRREEGTHHRSRAGSRRTGSDLKGLWRVWRHYDIANISGFESVGSMVVYEKGKPKNGQTTVNSSIQSVQGPNDYASTGRSADQALYP